jgi:hypothetical protein
MNDLTQILKESWALVEEEQDKVASYFYARMFLPSSTSTTLFASMNTYGRWGVTTASSMSSLITTRR